ncbi:unnamed protein product, partial [marine sediment metagenome]
MTENKIHIQGRLDPEESPDAHRVYQAMRKEKLTQGEIIELGLLAMGPMVLNNFTVDDGAL